MITQNTSLHPDKCFVIILFRNRKVDFLIAVLTISKVLWGSVAAQPFLVGGEEDGGVLVADEALQCPVLVLAVLAEAVLKAWQSLVE